MIYFLDEKLSMMPLVGCSRSVNVRRTLNPHPHPFPQGEVALGTFHFRQKRVEYGSS
jgi:hypothetical protein